MKRLCFLLTAVAFLSGLVAHAQTAGAKLTVEVTYTGSGTVDESHKVYVVLWDSPDFMKENSSTAPIALKGVSSKTGTAEFEDVQKNPVYVSMVYDPDGKWDAASAPPPGSSLGLYQKEPGTPEPIQLEAGKTTKIAATFDDSFKMQ